MIRLIRAFARDNRGVAAVELAAVAPILAGMFLGAYSVWDAASRRQDLRSALEAGAQYYINGGSDDAVASQIVAGAWSRRPNESTLTVTRNCKCQVTPLSCSSLCAGNAAPSIYAQITVTANDPGATISPRLTESRVIRVR